VHGASVPGKEYDPVIGYRAEVTREASKAPLSREVFADAALRIIDADGFDALSMRALGEQLGVHATAVYRHFASKDELVEAVMARMFVTSGVEVPDVGTPRDRIASLLRSLRLAFAQHPNLALPNLTFQDEQATVDFVRVALSLLREMGLRGRDVVVAYQMLETYSVGSNAYDWGNFPDGLEARRRGRRMVGDEAFDDCSRTLESMAALNEEAFEVGLRALLDACAAMAAADSPMHVTD
jgi:AcrR family transcriptional regulator